MSIIIFGHVEYKQFKYSYFARVSLERDATFLALLGGGPLQEQIRPCFALRGLPANISLLTGVDWFLRVTEEETDRERCVSRREAARWVEEGNAHWQGPANVTDPDLFQPSWLLATELEQVYSAYLKLEHTPLPRVAATVAAMHQLPEARLVYWFGN